MPCSTSHMTLKCICHFIRWYNKPHDGCHHDTLTILLYSWHAGIITKGERQSTDCVHSNRSWCAARSV